MNRVIEWLRGWAITLQIMIFERHIYRLLRDKSEFDPGDFVEVDEPHIHHESRERLLAAMDHDLMAIVLHTCKVCTFWDNDADRAGFVPCPVHAPLFGEVAR